MLLLSRPYLIRLREVSLPLLRTLIFSWRVSPRLVILRVAVAIALGLLPVCVALLTKLVVEFWSSRLFDGEWYMWQGLGASVCLVLLVFSRSLLGAVDYILHQAHSDKLRDCALVQGLSSIAKLGLSWFDFPEGHDGFQLGTEAAVRPAQILESLSELVQAIVVLIGFAWLVARLNFWFCLILGVGLIPGGAWMLSAARAHSAWHKGTARERRALDYYKYLLTSRSCAAELRSLGWAHILVDRTRELLKGLQDGRRRVHSQEILAELCAFGSSCIAIGVVLCWEATHLIYGLATFGDLAMLFHICRRGQVVFDMLLGSGAQLIRNGLLVRDFFDLIDKAPGQVDRIEKPNLSSVNCLELCNVSFGYPGQDQPCLSDLSMKFVAGEITVVLGRNGSGKSTLVKLLAGLYEPQCGVVRLAPHGTADSELLRREVGGVFQPPLRFEGSLREAVALEDCVFRRPDRVAKALKQASCQDFVSSLPNAHLSHLGTTLDHGIELSGGQWQRLALARALHQDTSVLVLDEPTSALDPWHDADWLDSLRKNVTNKVVVIVTHKLALAAKSDFIYVLDSGRVAQHGTHIQLMGQKGAYQSAWRGAFGEYSLGQGFQSYPNSREVPNQPELNQEESKRESRKEVIGVVPL